MPTGVGEASLHQMASAASIGSGLFAVGLRAGLVDQRLVVVAHQGSTVACTCALRTKLTGQTDGSGSFVFGGLAPRVMTTSGEPLTGRAYISVVWFVIYEVARLIDIRVATGVLAVQSAHMGADAALLQAPVIVNGSILLVADHCLDALVGMKLMLVDQILHPTVFLDVPGCGLHGCDYAVFVIHHPVTWFVCENCDFHLRLQNTERPPFFSSERVHEYLEAYDSDLLGKLRTRSRGSIESE